MKTFNTPASNQIELSTYTDLAPRTFTAACAAKLEALKTSLVAKLAAEFSDLHANLIRQAVDEADALAALTGFPHLLLPDLALEKVQGARDWAQHQEQSFNAPVCRWPRKSISHKKTNQKIESKTS